ncbi:MAG: TetR/AcrR family transcriptional regulator [Micromonosporaceae bacterium]|nr:TetR/AcrR family transcriptional regulator [Micromonosporaceae bacterium]
MTERTGDTRERIKEVALELFSEQGYEQTSLREIAERLGVTKAALYYHFKSKEEIVRAFVEDRVGQLAELIEWVKSQPPGPQTRTAFLQRYAASIDIGKQHSIMRFFQENQPALKSMEIGERMRERMLDLVEVLAGPDADPVSKLRTAFSVFVLHGGPFLLRDSGITDEQRRSAAMQLALELAGHPTPAEQRAEGATR